MKKYYVFKLNLKVLNIVAMLMLVFLLVLTFLLFPDLSKGILDLFKSLKSYLLFFICMVLYFILHEVLHAIGYIVHGADYKKLTFGMEVEKGVFYCLCKQDISKKNILFSLMYPLFFIGIVTYVISVIWNMPLLLILSIMNISGAAGDIMYFIFISGLDSDIKFTEVDDGTSFAILAGNNPDKRRHFGLEYVGEMKEVSRSDFKRLKISKLSFVILLIALLSFVILLFI